MTLKSTLKSLWPFGKSDLERIQKLLGDMDKALEEAKFRIGQSHADFLSLEKSLAAITSESHGNEEEKENIEREIECARQQTEQLKAVFADLSQKRRQIEISLNGCISSKKNADTNNFLSQIERDFGNDIKLNHYLEKFHETNFKVEFLASEKLKIEYKLNKKQNS